MNFVLSKASGPKITVQKAKTFSQSDLMIHIFLFISALITFKGEENNIYALIRLVSEQIK